MISIYIRSIKAFWPRKLYKKLTKLRKILNYIKFSCIIFCAKRSEYSRTFPFPRRIDIIWSKGIDKFCFWGIETFWVQKVTQEKFTKLTKIFELNQVVIHNSLTQIGVIFLIYTVIPKRIDTFWFGGIETFCP